MRRDGVELSLTATEFRLLVELARRPGQVFTRELLLQRVWDYEYLGESHLVDVAIQRLRAKVEDDPSHPTLIKTVRGPATGWTGPGHDQAAGRTRGAAQPAGRADRGGGSLSPSCLWQRSGRDLVGRVVRAGAPGAAARLPTASQVQVEEDVNLAAKIRYPEAASFVRDYEQPGTDAVLIFPDGRRVASDPQVIRRSRRCEQLRAARPAWLPADGRRRTALPTLACWCRNRPPSSTCSSPTDIEHRLALLRNALAAARRCPASGGAHRARARAPDAGTGRQGQRGCPPDSRRPA